ncbi:hypothetical protein XK27_11055 [Streptococcus suis]|nr:hypothetical protein XK27_11055 [Streptococcus suis]
MAYLPEERETVINYDELADTWTFETSVRRHITKIEKRIELYDILSEEIDERGRRVYLRVKMKNGTVSPLQNLQERNNHEIYSTTQESIKNALLTT